VALKQAKQKNLSTLISDTLKPEKRIHKKPAVRPVLSLYVYILSLLVNLRSCKNSFGYLNQAGVKSFGNK